MVDSTASAAGPARATMRSLAKMAPGEGNVVLREVPVPTIDRGEVLVAVKHVGICGSDVHIFHDTHPNHPPVTLGHEFSGVIHEVAPDVEGWSPGDRVVSELHGGACGRCRLCRTGNMFACPHKRPIGWWTDGAYADYLKVPAHLLHRVPDELSLVHASLTEPLAVCMNIFQRAPVPPEGLVAVIGPGPIGMFAALAAKAGGARAVAMIGRESSKERLAFARDLGIDHVIDSTRQDIEAEIAALSDGLGADMVIEAAGSEQAVRDAIRVVRKLGTIAALGVRAGDFRFPWNDALFKAIDIVFSFSANYLAFERSLSLLASGRVPADQILSERMPLERWRDAFEKLERREAMKITLDI